MSHRSMKEDIKASHNIPPALAFGGPLAFLGAGILGGAYHVFHRENVKFQLKTHVMPAMIASKALGIGSLLCIATFTIGVGLFSITTGIHTIKEFGEVSSKFVKNLTRDVKKPDSANDIPLTKEEQEVLDIAEKWVNKIVTDDNIECDRKRDEAELKKNKRTKS